MDNLKEKFLSCLKDLKGSGKFLSVHATAFLFPGLEVDGVGEVAYPINEIQAKALIEVAQKAPFGKGSKTILDNSVRSAWEIDAYRITFNSDRWTAFLNKILGNIKQDLGLEDYTISTHLYKLLIYEEGDFFLPHKDSEKEKGMFGTLVIGLPSKHTGGELVVSFDGLEEVADFAQNTSDYKINYAAFYADCDHEIKPLTSGYRVCLVYNLVHQKSPKKIQMIPIGTHAEKLAGILTKQQGNTKPHIVLLGHQYTPENFSRDGLKLNDRPKAEALLLAAQKAGCYAKMCLVTSYLSGMPEYTGGYDDHDEYGDEDAEMAEVYDESLYIEHWLENDIPALSNVGFEEDELIASFTLNGDDPIVKESTGYMGNYGPDLMHWYQYGAVMIWSPEANAQLILQQDAASKLEWVDYFNKNPQVLTDSEISAVEMILSLGLGSDSDRKDANYNAIATWIINRKEEDFFLRLNDQLCQFYFTKIDAAHWLKLINFFPSKITEKIFSLITQDITLAVVEQLLSVLRLLSTTGKLDSLVISQMKKLPQYFSALPINSSKKEFTTTSTALREIFWLEKKMPQEEIWVNLMTEIFLRHPERVYIHQVLVPQLLATTTPTQLAHRLLLTCREYLQERVNNSPQPPADWVRPMPSTDIYKSQWQLLKAFLESPDEKVFDYRKNQSERSEMEYAIRSVVVDLKIETIKKGSPHTLRITKTQAAYHREKKNWKEDVELLNEIIRKLEG